jgi:hypothetical protein
VTLCVSIRSDVGKLLLLRQARSLRRLSEQFFNRGRDTIVDIRSAKWRGDAAVIASLLQSAEDRRPRYADHGDKGRRC